MIWTIFSIFVVLWLIGMIAGRVFEGSLHLLLVAALITAIYAVLKEGREL